MYHKTVYVQTVGIWIVKYHLKNVRMSRGLGARRPDNNPIFPVTRSVILFCKHGIYSSVCLINAAAKRTSGNIVFFA